MGVGRLHPRWRSSERGPPFTPPSVANRNKSMQEAACGPPPRLCHPCLALNGLVGCRKGSQLHPRPEIGEIKGSLALQVPVHGPAAELRILIHRWLDLLEIVFLILTLTVASQAQASSAVDTFSSHLPRHPPPLLQ